jgi:hypothetical protein
MRMDVSERISTIQSTTRAQRQTWPSGFATSTISRETLLSTSTFRSTEIRVYHCLICPFWGKAGRNLQISGVLTFIFFFPFFNLFSLR